MTYKRKEVIGDATLYLGDCMDILPTLDSGSVNWCVTSPPYNLNKSAHTSAGAKTSANASMKKKYDEWYFDDMPEEEYQSWQIDVISELRRVCSESIFYNHRIRYAWHSRNKNSPPSKVYHPMDWLRNFPIWCEIIWDRAGGSTPTGRYQQAHELIYQIGKPRKVKKSLGMLDVWRVTPSRGSGHVCSFPEEIARRCLSPNASDGDIVIDPFMGAGTVGAVCAQSGYSFIGIEIEEKYFDIACERIRQAYAQGRLFE